MFEKAKEFILNGIRKAKDKIIIKRNPIKWVVFSYFGMVSLLVMTYYSAWLYQWNEGKVVLLDLLSLIREMVGASMVAFVTFIATCFIDKDHDDIPDYFEKDDEKNEDRD